MRNDETLEHRTSALHQATVSVVCAAYNEAEHLPRLLASLAAQSLRPTEIIVVDDGSTDGTASVARSFGAQVRRVPHRGPALARNEGASLARGDVLVFIDGDMSCAPEFLDRLTRPIRADEVVGTFTKEIYLGNAGNGWARAYCSIRRLGRERLLTDDFPNEWANFRAIRRDAFLAVGGYDDVGYGEDMTLAPKLRSLAVAAEGARCWHFNPASAHEIFENGRWIGRGHDIGLVPHPWRDNSPVRVLCLVIRGVRSGFGKRVLPARLAYHAGALIGMTERKLHPKRHWK